MGSGAVGVEFASIFRRFGSEVTIIELLPRLVPVEDEAVSAELEKSFKKQGIKSLTGHQGDQGGGNGARRRHRGAGDRTARRRSCRPTSCSWRPAAGPVTTGLGAEALGIAMEKGYIKVDSLYRTSVPEHLRHRRRDYHRRAGCIRSSRTSRRRKASWSRSGSPDRTSGR